MSKEKKNKPVVDVADIPQKEYLLSLTAKHDKFKDKFGTSYVRFGKEGHYEIHPLHSSAYKHHLIQELFKVHGQKTKSGIVDSVIEIIESEVISIGATYNIRIAWHDDCIWYDLADPLWRAVKIDDNGWSIVSKPPILFKRPKNMQQQVVPVEGGQITKIFNFINMPPKFKVLLLVNLIADFIPDIDYPVTIFWGKPGTGKTSACRILKSLVDPSVADIISFPSSEREMIQVMSKNHMTVFDNISRISWQASDILCRASTGGAFMSRELYKDDSDIIRKLHQPVVLNGLYQLGVANDLISRSMFFELEEIDSTSMEPTSQFLKRFEQEKPFILGRIFDCVSGALKNKKTIKIADHDRMGDFKDWGVAIASTFKSGGVSAFLKQLEKMGTIRNREALLGQPLANAVELYIKRKHHFKGSATTLYKDLCEEAKHNKINIKHPLWPQGANAMTRFLNNIDANLAQAGISYEHSRKRSGSIIELTLI